MDGPREGCPPPYATCTRLEDARAREVYLRALERLRDAAIACQRWADPDAGETVELLDDEVEPETRP